MMPDASARPAAPRDGSLTFGCALILVLMLAGCTTPRIEGFVDPAHRNARYDSFLAYAAFSDLGLEAVFERQLCARLLAAGHACTTMLAAASPTRVQNGASRHAAAVASGAGALIIIELADPNNAVRHELTRGGPAFDIRVVDNKKQVVTARLAIQSSPGKQSARHRAATLATAIVAALSE